MASNNGAAARRLEPEQEYAPAEDGRRRWVSVTSQLDTSEPSEAFPGFAPPAPQRARRTPTTVLRGQTVPAQAPTEQLRSRAVQQPGLPFAQGQAQAAPVRATTSAVASHTKMAGLAAGAVAGLLVLYVALSALFTFAQTTMDDIRYGRPRTTHLTAFFGHAGEQAEQPSHLVALNLDRRILLIELPGGDTKDATTITGPYLFGEGEDLTPAQMAAEDVNGDGLNDLLVTVKNEQLVYINDKDKNSFHLMTPEERSGLPSNTSTSSGGGGPPAGGQK